MIKNIKYMLFITYIASSYMSQLLNFLFLERLNSHVVQTGENQFRRKINDMNDSLMELAKYVSN